MSNEWKIYWTSSRKFFIWCLGQSWNWRKVTLMAQSVAVGKVKRWSLVQVFHRRQSPFLLCTFCTCLLSDVVDGCRNIPCFSIRLAACGSLSRCEICVGRQEFLRGQWRCKSNRWIGQNYFLKFEILVWLMSQWHRNLQEHVKHRFVWGLNLCLAFCLSGYPRPAVTARHLNKVFESLLATWL